MERPERSTRRNALHPVPPSPDALAEWSSSRFALRLARTGGAALALLLVVGAGRCADSDYRPLWHNWGVVTYEARPQRHIDDDREFYVPEEKWTPQIPRYAAAAGQGDPRGQALADGWKLFQAGKFAEAEALFERLYREKADQKAGEGLFYSLLRLGDRARMASLAATLGGPLRDLWTKEDSRQLYGRKEFAAAEAEAPGLNPGLKNFADPSVTTYGSYREKTGQPGLGRFRESVEGLEGVFYANHGLDKITSDIERVSLESDSLAPNSFLGHPPAAGGSYVTRPLSDLHDLSVFRLQWERSGWTAPYAQLETTPLGGPVFPLPTGKFGLRQQEENGFWAVEAYGDPVKESLLSYTGIRDPYTGRNWGRVVDVGAAARGYLGLGGGWGFYGEGKYGWDVGEGVEANEHVALSIGLSRNIPIKGFDQFTVGPSLLFEHFERNLSGYTAGQGGYFSPEHLIEGTLGVHFLTDEGKNFILEGSVGPGVQQNNQSASPVYPLNPDGRMTPGDDNSSFVFSTLFRGGVLLTRSLELSAYGGYSKSADYNDITGGLALRYFFAPRNGLVSADLK